MLGEDHSLVNEFPEYLERMSQLNQADKVFAIDAKRYHLLDSEIRSLELNNSPIEDETLHHMKQERAILKDKLYRQLANGG